MVERIRTLLESRQLTPTQFADLIGVARPIVSHILSGRNKPSLEVVQRILAAMPELAMPWLLNGSGPMLVSSVASGAETVLDATVVGPVQSMPTPNPAGPAVPALPVPLAPAAASVPEPIEMVQLVYAQTNVPENQNINAQGAPVEAPTVKRTAATAEPTASRGNRPAPFKPAAARHAAVPKRFVAVVAPVSKADGPSQQEAAPEPLRPSVAASDSPRVAMPAPVDAPFAAVPFPPIVPPASTGNTPAAPGENPENAMARALLAGAEKPIRRIVIFYHDGSFADYQPE